jgi:hypothetical protein
MSGVITPLPQYSFMAWSLVKKLKYRDMPGIEARTFSP